MINLDKIQKISEQKYFTFLRSLITKEKFFPLEFSAGSPPKDFPELQKAVVQLIDHSKQKLGYGYEIELVNRRTQKYGQQSLPQRIYFETESDYLKFIKKQKEVEVFKANINLIQKTVPQLGDWLGQNVRKVIEYSDDWHDLLKVCQYFQYNPQPNLYIRELPIAIHTKFIEQHKGLLRNLLEAILPDDKLISIDGEKDNVFEKRFSLRYTEQMIRIRFLDRLLIAKYCLLATDVTIPISEFRQFNLETHPCFITENKMNFLTLPALANSIAIFGGGYAVQSLKNIPWLSNFPIFYWGDLDTDGFAILSQLRAYFPQTVSIMMDIKTFNTFQEFSVSVKGASVGTLPNLTPDELTVYHYLATSQKRLEQEHISFSYANEYLKGLKLLG